MLLSVREIAYLVTIIITIIIKYLTNLSLQIFFKMVSKYLRSVVMSSEILGSIVSVLVAKTTNGLDLPRNT